MRIITSLRTLYLNEKELDDVFTNDIRWTEAQAIIFASLTPETAGRQCTAVFPRPMHALKLQLQCQSITDFVKPVVGPIGTETVDNIQRTQRPVTQREMIENAIERISHLTHIGQQQSRERKDLQSKYDYVRHIAVHRYLMLIRDDHATKMTSSLSIAKAIFPSERNEYRARMLRVWAKFYVLNLSNN
jgi:hypothetical protein